MCGRYTLTESVNLIERFNLDGSDNHPQPRYNIAPTQNVPVILNESPNKITMVRWGLIPFWAKEASIGQKIINARAETLDQRPSFKHCLQRKRCIIPTDGFYEWKKDGSTKKPYRITLENGELFGFAGLWDTWQDPVGQIIRTCTIITTTPNELIEPIHNRMPVILPKESEHDWLDSTIDGRLMTGIFKPYPADIMTVYEVPSLVNSPKNDVVDCIAPIKGLF